MRLGTTSQKIILLLSAGVALGFSRSSSHQRKIINAAAKEWRDINRHELYRSIKRLYESKLINYKEDQDGTIKIELNKEGGKIALNYKIDELKIPGQDNWDGKWRIVLFDIPERMKPLRDSLRTRLRQIGMRELQKSVFVHPFECQNEIDFLIEIYDARRFVRFIEASKIDNELHFKHKFNLL